MPDHTARSVYLYWLVKVCTNSLQTSSLLIFEVITATNSPTPLRAADQKLDVSY